MPAATEFPHRVLAWYDRHGRKNLPWQQPRTPYRVWISEIMLQQTQVATVIPYFLRFMDRFPSLESLAEAPVDDVLSHWAGLGYYARARNLHRAAQALNEDHGGHWPRDLETVNALPGIGRSTAGAILSLGLGSRAAILDGNVKRVLCRWAGIAGWPGETATARELWELSEKLTPHERSGDYNQAMMDLGATVCTRSRPACADCPLQTDCVAFKGDLTAVLPSPKPRRTTPVKHCLMLVLRDENGRIFLEKRPPTGIWGGLWSLPEFADRAELDGWLFSHAISGVLLESRPPRRHTFSHFHLDFVPLLARTRSGMYLAESGRSDWRDPATERTLPAPIARLLAELEAAESKPDTHDHHLKTED
ncbi:A/G-specific adenine glycosylase [Methylococcus sp. EFPC2]|uniref:A/G-specific adenine glycosylase n=1 Tax=Methylococcus sp. EFPC2 TaxID=2812648 RepID=UPI001F07FEA9|nr:A/G-specific adenine glycosylase [Methylococcus sp. EFPC2]